MKPIALALLVFTALPGNAQGNYSQIDAVQGGKLTATLYATATYTASSYDLRIKQTFAGMGSYQPSYKGQIWEVIDGSFKDTYPQAYNHLYQYFASATEQEAWAAMNSTDWFFGIPGWVALLVTSYYKILEMDKITTISWREYKTVLPVTGWYKVRFNPVHHWLTKPKTSVYAIESTGNKYPLWIDECGSPISTQEHRIFLNKGETSFIITLGSGVSTYYNDAGTIEYVGLDESSPKTWTIEAPVATKTVSLTSLLPSEYSSNTMAVSFEGYPFTTDGGATVTWGPVKRLPIVVFDYTYNPKWVEWNPSIEVLQPSFYSSVQSWNGTTAVYNILREGNYTEPLLH